MLKNTGIHFSKFNAQTNM